MDVNSNLNIPISIARSGQTEPKKGVNENIESVSTSSVDTVTISNQAYEAFASSDDSDVVLVPNGTGVTPPPPPPPSEVK